MSSELAIATAQIVEVLPPEKRTQANIQWVESSLQQGSPEDVLAMCKQYLGVSNAQIVACQKRLEAHEIRFDQLVKYAEQNFREIRNELSEVKQRLAVQEAVENVRSQNQQFLLGKMMDAQNSTNQAVVNAAKGGGEMGSHAFARLWLGLGFGIIILSIAISYLGQIQAKPEAKQCGIDVECDVRPLQRPAPASNFKGGV